MEEINAESRQCWAEQNVRVPEGLFVRSCRYRFKFIFDNEVRHQKVRVWLDENTFHIFDWEDFYSYFFF